MNRASALINAQAVRDRLQRIVTVERIGRVTAIVGTVVRARVPDVCIGERCTIERRKGDAPSLIAEVIGFDEDRGVLLMPLGRAEGIAQDDQVLPVGRFGETPCGEAVRGRVLNALGEPIDGRGPLASVATTPLMSPPPDPMNRARITEPLNTGIRAIDVMHTIGRGQRVGIFAPAGGGKSTLLASIARNAEADAVVLALIGERGREVAPFIQDNLGEAGLSKSTIVVSTSNEPALLRLKAAHTASAIAEAERRRGKRVVLLMDSVTRFARALREVGLSAGELPARRGFPPSVFAELPLLFERAGNDDRGSITAFYTVLVEGDIADDPIAEESKSLLDGHLVLSERLAHRQHYPAIDPLSSKSRLADEIIPPEHAAAARMAKQIWSTYENARSKIELGIYEAGASPDIDRAVRHFPAVESFLNQPADQPVGMAEGVAQLRRILGD
jgi:type III secretion protein N (ATPase)